MEGRADEADLERPNERSSVTKALGRRRNTQIWRNDKLGKKKVQPSLQPLTI